METFKRQDRDLRYEICAHDVCSSNKRWKRSNILANETYRHAIHILKAKPDKSKKWAEGSNLDVFSLKGLIYNRRNLLWAAQNSDSSNSANTAKTES